MSQTTNPPTVKPSRGEPARRQHDGNGAPDANAHPGEGVPRDLKPPSNGAVVIAVSAFAVLLIVLFVVGWVPHHREVESARTDAADRANQLPVVIYRKLAISAGTHDVILPCDVKANQANRHLRPY